MGSALYHPGNAALGLTSSIDALEIVSMAGIACNRTVNNEKLVIWHVVLLILLKQKEIHEEEPDYPFSIQKQKIGIDCCGNTSFFARDGLEERKSTMDPITAAVVAAISAGAIGGLTEVSKTALADAYGKLKALLVKKFGKESDVVQAVEQVETKPASEARKAALAEEVAAVKADHDAELLQVAQAVQQVLQSSSGNAGHTQTATGNYIAQADRGSNASVHIGTPPPSGHPSSTDKGRVL